MNDMDAGQSEEHRHFVRTEIALLKSAQQAQAADMSELKVQFATGMQQIQANLQALSAEFVNSRKANWGEYRGWIFGGATVLGMILTMGGVVLALFVQASIGPLTTAAELSVRDRMEIHDTLKGFSDLASARGERLSSVENQAAGAAVERTENRARLDRIATAMGTQGERITALERDLRETEAQFCSLSDQVNLRFINAHRFISLLWAKTMRQEFPPEFFAPKVGRCVQN